MSVPSQGGGPLSQQTASSLDLPPNHSRKKTKFTPTIAKAVTYNFALPLGGRQENKYFHKPVPYSIRWLLDATSLLKPISYYTLGCMCPPPLYFLKNFRFMDSLVMLVFADRADWQCDSYSLSCPLGITKDHAVWKIQQETLQGIIT